MDNKGEFLAQEQKGGKGKTNYKELIRQLREEAYSQDEREIYVPMNKSKEEEKDI